MALTLSELARLVDGDIVRGGPDLSVDGIASLDEAGPSEVSFLGNEKYRSQYLVTRAGAVIVPRGVEEGAEGCGLGLAIVREIAESHGAEIMLRDGPNGVGTTVQVAFPPAA